MHLPSRLKSVEKRAKVQATFCFLIYAPKLLTRQCIDAAHFPFLVPTLNFARHNGFNRSAIVREFKTVKRPLKSQIGLVNWKTDMLDTARRDCLLLRGSWDNKL